MSVLSKELVQEIIEENDFKNPGAIISFLKEAFKDVLQEMLEAEMVCKITERILPEIEEWQSRPLEALYPFVFMDAMHYKVRTDGQIVNRAAYVVMGVDVSRKKDILGIWIGENESSKFWLGVLNDLKNRGIEDVLIFCVDELTGLKEAIAAAYPKSEIQRCIIHQLRNSFKYVSYKDLKAFSRDFKTILPDIIYIMHTNRTIWQ